MIASMRRLRYSGKLASWLALFALAVQFAVSFGHVHVDGIRGADSAAALVLQQTKTAQSLPSPQGGDKDDYCAICASIYLVANSFVPPPPLLPVPLIAAAIDHIDRGAAIFIAPRRLAFQSRAPPLA
jgi:hypothetical protein